MRVIVTGAASGIGRAVALGLANNAAKGERARVFLVDRDADKLEEVAAEVRKAGADATAMVADLSDTAVPDKIAAEAAKTLGGLDALVSNAGILAGALLKDLSLADYDRMFDINTRATWLLGKATHPLLSRQGGAIVATASISSENPTPPLGAYSASKAALVMLVRQMAVEWGPDGIRCNCVSPGPTLTPMTEVGYADASRRAQREASIPMRRLGRPEDIANTILFLISPAAEFISGVNIMVDGGLNQMLMPASGSGTGQTKAG